MIFHQNYKDTNFAHQITQFDKNKFLFHHALGRRLVLEAYLENVLICVLIFSYLLNLKLFLPLFVFSAPKLKFMTEQLKKILRLSMTIFSKKISTYKKPKHLCAYHCINVFTCVESFRYFFYSQRSQKKGLKISLHLTSEPD